MSNIEVKDDKVLGLTMVSDKATNMTYAVSAQYAADSTESLPVVRLTANYKHETTSYEIKICDINPKRASMKEMFALCCHVDARGILDGGSFGTFHLMKQYMKNAAKKGMCEKVNDYTEFLCKKLDWDVIATFMKDEFLAAGLLEQYQDCLRIIDTMDYFYTKYHFEEPVRKEKFKKTVVEKKEELVSDITVKRSYLLGEKRYTLEEWRDFLNSFDKIGDAISAMMKAEMLK